MSKLFKMFTATILVLVLSFSLFSCDGNGEISLNSVENAYGEKIEQLIESLDGGVTTHYDADDVRIEANLGVELSAALLEMIESYTEYDFSWVNDAKINLTENIKNNIISMSLDLGYDKTDIVTAEFIMDILGGDMFMSIPTLSDKFIKEEGEIDTASLELMENMKNLIPDGELLGDVLKECFSTMLAGVTQFSYTEAELDVIGVKQSCVACEVKMSQSELVGALANVLEMLAVSEDFKALVFDFVTEYGKLAGDIGTENMGGALGATPEQIYEYIKYEISSMSQQLKLAVISGLLSNDTALVWTSYLTDDIDLIGMEMDISLEGETATVYIASAENGNDKGFDAYVASGNAKLFEICGVTTDDGKKLSGSYELLINGQSMLFIDLADVDSKELDKKGVFVGSVTVSPSKGLIDMLGEYVGNDSSAVGLLLSNLSIKFDVLKNNEEKLEAEMSIISGRVPYATVSIDAKFSKGKDVKLPSDALDDIEEWYEDIDFDKFIKNINKSGLPEYVIELIMSEMD